MRAHHERAIARVTEAFRDDPRYLAAVIGGSVAKGLARDHSDIDAVFIASEEEWQRRRAAHDYFLYRGDLCDYPGGYLDGKVVDLQFLRDAADHGSEPARWAFQEAFVAYSRLPEVEHLVAAIPVYPEHERDRKLAAFYGHAALYASYFVPEAEKSQNRYLLWQAATSTVLFAGRLLLAYNRALFPSHKWLLHAIEKAPEKPADFLPRAQQLLDAPTGDRARALWECVQGFREWGLSYDLAVGRFIESAEWGWREGLPGPGPAEW